MFSEKGMKTVPEKIQEIQETPASERRKSLTKFSRIDQLHEKIYTRLQHRTIMDKVKMYLDTYYATNFIRIVQQNKPSKKRYLLT